MIVRVRKVRAIRLGAAVDIPGQILESISVVIRPREELRGPQSWMRPAKLQQAASIIRSVSYTHLDVYKRQDQYGT